MRTGKTIGDFLFGKVRLGVLLVLYRHPDRSFFLREIARATGISPGPVQRELVGLHGAGIVTREARGRQVYFQADPACSIFGELCGIASRIGHTEAAAGISAPAGSRVGDGLSKTIASALAPLSDRIRSAFLLAPVKEAAPGVPSDLLVVGKIELDELAALLVRAGLSDRVHPIVMTKKEFRRGQKGKDSELRRRLRSLAPLSLDPHA